MNRKQPNPETIRLKEMAQALFNAYHSQYNSRNYNRYDKRLSGEEIVREASYWDELLTKGASPNILLDRSPTEQNVFHVGRLVHVFAPLFEVYIKHSGPLDYVEKDRSSEYVTLPKQVVGTWRQAKRDKQKMMDKEGCYTLSPDDWAFDKMMILKAHGITTTVTGRKTETILDDVLTHEFLLSHNDHGKSDGQLLRKMMEEGFWFNKKEERELYKGGVREILPHIYRIIDAVAEKRALQEELLDVVKNKPSSPTKKM